MMTQKQSEIWIFAYGSLMWNPGFDYADAVRATAYGYHRAFCVYSYRYRGTEEQPGLVLGLDRGGMCQGVAYRVDPEKFPPIREYLWEREMITNVYKPTMVNLGLHDHDGRRVRAITFVVDRSHRQYTGRLDLAVTARLIRQGHGERGSCRDYLVNTVRHIEEIGACTGKLGTLVRMVEDAETVSRE